MPEGAQGEGGRMGSYVLGFKEIDQTQVAVTAQPKEPLSIKPST
jgi:hypothetical protein